MLHGKSDEKAVKTHTIWLHHHSLSEAQSCNLRTTNRAAKHGCSPVQASDLPAGNGIRVEFEGAAFDDMMLWLGDVNRQYGLLVQSGSFSAASGESPGRVNSTLTLER